MKDLSSILAAALVAGCAIGPTSPQKPLRQPSDEYYQPPAQQVAISESGTASQPPKAEPRWHLATPDMPGHWRPGFGHGSGKQGLGNLVNENLQAQLSAKRLRGTVDTLEWVQILGRSLQSAKLEKAVRLSDTRCSTQAFSQHDGLLRGMLAVCALGPDGSVPIVFHGDWVSRHDDKACADFVTIVRSAEMYWE